MTAREKIAFQNLRIAMLEEFRDVVCDLSARQPKTDISDAKGLWFRLTLEMLDRIDDKQDQARIKIGQIQEIENELAA